MPTDSHLHPPLLLPNSRGQHGINIRETCTPLRSGWIRRQQEFRGNLQFLGNLGFPAHGDQDGDAVDLELFRIQVGSYQSKKRRRIFIASFSADTSQPGTSVSSSRFPALMSPPSDGQPAYTCLHPNRSLQALYQRNEASPSTPNMHIHPIIPSPVFSMTNRQHRLPRQDS
jgi:hypothetical protein